MEFRTRPIGLDEIRPWRDMYRLEMGCQIIHDSIHDRLGWSDEYLLIVDAVAVGYGSVAVGGPWKTTPAVYEFYVVPDQRLRVFDLFAALLEASGAEIMEVQSNDALAAAMLHTFAVDVASESILFEDGLATDLHPRDAVFHDGVTADDKDLSDEQLRWRGVVEAGGQVVASGGVLFHYNPPYGDIYMEVAETHRRRGYGSFLVQELKRLCYARGYVPGARCNPANDASRRTLQKAGFVPCGHMLAGRLR